MKRGQNNTRPPERYFDRSYIGKVKGTTDASLSGKIKVWIAELDTREDDEEGWIVCTYCSPFAGSTEKGATSETQTGTFDGTQTAYGMWMVPPDIDNEVLVMFPAGAISRAVWVGCLFKEFMLHDVPATAASNKNVQNKTGVVNAGAPVPVAEYNKWDRSSDTGNPADPVRPWNEPRTRGIGEQGLLTDNIRGLSSSSAMRESPSQVFGINTPGPKNPKNSTPENGIARLGGNSFVMDDGDENGNDEYIGFRTRSGASVRIDEATGMIYIINKKGTAWFQMDDDGNVDIFSAGSISMRAKKDFNVRADGDVNIEAGNNINIKAAQDSGPNGERMPEGTGVGGDIAIQALNNYDSVTGGDHTTTVKNGNMDTTVQSGGRTASVGGSENLTVAGIMATSVGITYGLSSIALNISPTGSVDSMGSVIAKGPMYGFDFLTPLTSLSSHQHTYMVPQHAAGMANTLSMPMGGGLMNVCGPTASRPSKAKPIKTQTKLDTLKDFVGTTPIHTGNGNSNGDTTQIPNYWDRKTEPMNTIVSRLMSYEPCNDHVVKGQPTSKVKITTPTAAERNPLDPC